MSREITELKSQHKVLKSCTWTKTRSGSLERRLSGVHEDEPFMGDIAPVVQGDLDALLSPLAELDEPDAPGTHEPG